MENRFTRSELRALHVGVLIISVAILFFCVTSQTLLKPAIRSLRFQKTVCKVMRKEITQQTEESFSNFGNSHDHNECFNAQHLSTCTKVIIHYRPLVKIFEKPSFQGKKFENNSSNHQSFSANMQQSATLSHPVWQFDQAYPEHNQQQALLYMNDVDLLYNDECSFHLSCTRDIDGMSREANSFLNKIHFPGNCFHCYYDPINPSVTFVSRTFDEWSIFHSIFWPLILLLTGTLVIIILFCWIARMKQAIKKRLIDKDTKNL